MGEKLREAPTDQSGARGARGGLALARLGAIPHAVTGALWWARPGLYRIHTFVWFAVQTAQNGLQRAERLGDYLPLDLVLIAPPAAF